MSEKKKIASPFFKIALVFFLLSLISLFLSAINDDLRIKYLNKISGILRLIPLSVSNLVPVSVFEIIIYSSPFWIFFLIMYCTSGYNRNKGHRRFLNFIAILLVFASLYISNFSIGYFSETQRVRASGEELISAAEKLSEKLDSSDEVITCELDFIGEKIYNSYLGLNDERVSVLSLSPRAKSVKSEYLFTKLGILGMYSFVSSEILVNPAAPEYTMPFTVAHEMAHAFGVAREDEASLLAYLALKESGDVSFIYSAEVFALQSILSEIYKISPVDYFRIYSTLPEGVKSEFKLYRDFYSEGYVTDVSEKINGGLISLFDKDGGESYSYFASVVAKEINKG